MKYLLGLLLICGCNAYQDLDDIAVKQKDCKDFQARYEAVKPKESTILIVNKIGECKKAGAWVEPEVKK